MNPSFHLSPTSEYSFQSPNFEFQQLTSSLRRLNITLGSMFNRTEEEKPR